jgi:hypothetical protein
MNITLSLSVIDELITSAPFLDNHLSWSVRDSLKNKDFDKNQTIYLDLSDVKKENCILLEKLLTEKKYSGKTINTLTNWIKNLNNPKDAVITSLPMLEKTLLSIFKNSKHKWVLMVNPDGMVFPCAVSAVKYRARGRDDDAYTNLTLSFISIVQDRWSHDEREIKKDKITKSINFYKSDITDISEDDFNAYSSSGSIDFNDDDDDDSEDKKKPKPKAKPASKKDSFLLSKILAGKNIMLMDDDYVETYQKDLEKANTISKVIGKVFTCETKGYVISDTKNGMTSWKDLNEENKSSKLVVDNVKVGSITYAIQAENIGAVEMPEHPYILTYDITSFRYAVVHANNITPYKYNAEIIDKLVISPQRKKILSSLIGSKNNFEDLISGKSGGIVILSTGESGLGKTLTAEVYSEVMGKPLYCVQSSQLGISVADIEINLNKILYRAEKWDAVLLIDEADSYIYKRGNDILQNCIVGTFLRLMEYYNGILFLTSNRPETIDDAIISRVTLHIKYDLPTFDETLKLWSILCENFGMTIETPTIDKLWATYKPFSGRDIRNTLKDISKCFPKEKKVEFDMIKELEDFLPFIKLKENESAET